MYNNRSEHLCWQSRGAGLEWPLACSEQWCQCVIFPPRRTGLSWRLRFRRGGTIACSKNDSQVIWIRSPSPYGPYISNVFCRYCCCGESTCGRTTFLGRGPTWFWLVSGLSFSPRGMGICRSSILPGWRFSFSDLSLFSHFLLLLFSFLSSFFRVDYLAPDLRDLDAHGTITSHGLFLSCIATSAAPAVACGL